MTNCLTCAGAASLGDIGWRLGSAVAPPRLQLMRSVRRTGVRIPLVVASERRVAPAAPGGRDRL